MSASDDKNLPWECDWCNDDRGLCDRPHLDALLGKSLYTESYQQRSSKNDATAI